MTQETDTGIECGHWRLSSVQPTLSCLQFILMPFSRHLPGPQTQNIQERCQFYVPTTCDQGNGRSDRDSRFEPAAGEPAVLNVTSAQSLRKLLSRCRVQAGCCTVVQDPSVGPGSGVAHCTRGGHRRGPLPQSSHSKPLQHLATRYAMRRSLQFAGVEGSSRLGRCSTLSSVQILADSVDSSPRIHDPTL